MPKDPRFTQLLDFPVYCLQFTKDHQLLIGGGGGTSKSGVKNKLALYDVDMSKKELKEVTSLTFGDDEDAPMCMSYNSEKRIIACGINAAEEDIRQGRNNNCRIFKLSNEDEKTYTLKAERAVAADTATDEEHYLKTIRINDHGEYVACGSTSGDLAIFKYPSMELAYPIKNCNKEVIDLDMDAEADKIAVVCENELSIWDLQNNRQLETLDSPVLNGKLPCNFRAVRFGRGESSGSLFFIVNSNDRKHAVLCKVHSISFQRQRQEGISRHPATSLEISSQGRWLAFATADLAVGVVCAQTLDVVRYFEHVHTFAITSLAFSPDARLLASGSAAGACHVVQLPTYMKKKYFLSSWTVGVVLFIVVVLYLVYVQPLLLGLITQWWPGSATPAHMEQNTPLHHDF